MITAHRKMKHTMNLPMVVAISLGTSLIATLLLAVLGGYLIWNETIPQGAAGIWAAATRFLAVLVVSGFAMMVARERKAIVSGIATVAYMSILACLNILVFDGKFDNILLGILISALAWGISVMVYASIRSRAGKRRKFKIR